MVLETGHTGLEAPLLEFLTKAQGLAFTTADSTPHTHSFVPLAFLFHQADGPLLLHSHYHCGGYRSVHEHVDKGMCGWVAEGTVATRGQQSSRGNSFLGSLEELRILERMSGHMSVVRFSCSLPCTPKPFYPCLPMSLSNFRCSLPSNRELHPWWADGCPLPLWLLPTVSISP